MASVPHAWWLLLSGAVAPNGRSYPGLATVPAVG
jgi:hypothetical protein